MSNYVKTTDFGVKDVLATGDPDKKILGAAYDTEFDAIAIAVATKVDLTTTGTFTATLTGMTAPVTFTATYYKFGRLVYITVPGTPTGISNSAQMTLTGIPAGLEAVGGNLQPVELFDAATLKAGTAYFPSALVIQFQVFAVVSTYISSSALSFTSSGTKGLVSSTSFKYFSLT